MTVKDVLNDMGHAYFMSNTYLCFSKMKKVALLFFTLIYLVSVSGVAWGNFYCCGKLKETFLFSSKQAVKISKSCKGNKLPGCCDTKTFFSKVKDNHSPSNAVKVADTFGKKLLQSNAFELPISQSTYFVTGSFTPLHAPPLISKQPVYLSICTFRI